MPESASTPEEQPTERPARLICTRVADTAAGTLPLGSFVANCAQCSEYVVVDTAGRAHLSRDPRVQSWCERCVVIAAVDSLKASRARVSDAVDSLCGAALAGNESCATADALSESVNEFMASAGFLHALRCRSRVMFVATTQPVAQA